MAAIATEQKDAFANAAQCERRTRTRCIAWQRSRHNLAPIKNI
jgi:hypothetical protein